MENILSNLSFLDVTEVVVPKFGLCKAYHPTGRHNVAMLYKPYGKSIYRYRGKEVISDYRNVVILPTNIAYYYECVEPGVAYRLELDVIGKFDEFISIPCSREIEANFIKMAKIYESIIVDKFALMSEFYNILSILNRNSNNEDKRSKLIYQKTIRYIRENFKQNIKFDQEIAKQLNISVVYLRKCFFEYAQMPLKQFVLAYRMNYAKRMLLHGTSVTEISKEVGYSSIYSFSREFKKKTGFSPSEYKTDNI